MSTTIVKKCDRCEKVLHAAANLQVLEQRVFGSAPFKAFTFDACGGCFSLLLMKLEELRVEFGPKGK